ncbi:MAG: ketopantoate reductase family protein [Actinobacteria bacterium]|nr:ketopantoate reductase family protein [Actinomycetota bacterium]
MSFSRLLIVGLGNIGTTFGWALSEEGVDTTHVVREGKGSLFEQGIKLNVLDLREEDPTPRLHLYVPKVVEEVSPEDGYDLVMIPTKHYQLAVALRDYRDRVGLDTSFLIFCANWEGPQVVDEILPRARYTWGYSATNGGPSGDVLCMNLRKDYRIGKIEGSPKPLLQSVIELFGRAGLEPDLKEDMLGWLLAHHALNAGLIGAALYAGGQQELTSDPEALQLMAGGIHEALAVVKARGVDVSIFPDIAPFLELSDEGIIALIKDSFFKSPAAQRAIKSGHFKASPEEMKSFYLDVLHTGEEMGIPMPSLEAMKARIEGEA